LSQSKKKKASRASLRKALRYLLNCTERNLGHIDRMLDMVDERGFPLAHKYQRQLWVIHTLYEQQRGMYDARRRRCDDRIVSIFQPHVRPIVRGKSGKRVEFGGYLTHQTISWDAYNEASDLADQAEAYRLLTGHYPELIQCDKIYHTNDNRKWCSERDIRMTALPKGPKTKLSAYH